VIILAPIFYAQKDFKTPMRGSLLAVSFNLVLNSFFVFLLKSNAEGIALATSISSWVNCLYLFYRLSEEKLNLLPFSMIKNFCKSLLTASVALIFTQWIGFIYLDDTSLYSAFLHVDKVKIFPRLSLQISSFALLGFIYCFTFFVMGIVGKLFSPQDIYASVQKKFLAKREQV
jgi:putative peptidoglycan lipid II flippase